MSVRILTTDDDAAVIYDSTTEWALGPIFYGTDDRTAEEIASAFLDSLPQDARTYNDTDLEALASQFVSTLEPLNGDGDE